MGKISFSRKDSQIRSYRPAHGYRQVIAQCPNCLRIWCNVGIRYRDDEFMFDFDPECDLIGEAVFDFKEGKVYCESCGKELKFFKCNPITKK